MVFARGMIGSLSCSLVRWFFPLALVGLVGCVTTSDGPSPDDPDAPKKLVIGVTGTTPPLIFKSGREFRGMEAELGRRFAAVLGREPEFREMRFSELTNALVSGEIDIIMSGMTITRDRSARVNFTYPYLRVGQLAMIQRSRYDELAYNIPGFDGRVGVIAATTGDQFVQQRMPKARRMTFEDPEDAADALARGRIDLFIHDAPTVWWLAGENENRGLMSMEFFLTEEFLAWAVAKENLWLFAEANRFIETETANGNIPAMVDRWMPIQ